MILTIITVVHIVTKHSKLHAFQFKLLNNPFQLDKMLFKFGKIRSPFCYFCNLKVLLLRLQVLRPFTEATALFVCLSNSLKISIFNPQSANFGLINRK